MAENDLDRVGRYSSTPASNAKTVYDLRSDTVTKQPKEMLEAMISAEVGDDTYHEDPTVEKLEKRMAEITGKEAALFVTNGTGACQILARSVLGPPPAVVLCHERTHVYTLQSMGIPFHCGAGFKTVLPKNREPECTLKLEDIIDSIVTVHDIHIAQTKLVCIENTMDGVVMPIQDQKEIYEHCKKLNIPVNLDGSRLWNAHIKTGISIKEYCKYADNVTMCFSKGLCAPVGSIIAGSRETIEKCRHYRKLYGGAWRQGGYLAAACLWAIDNVLPKLHEDHEKIAKLYALLKDSGLIIKNPPETNMMFFSLPKGLKIGDYTKKLSSRGVRIFDWGRIVAHQQIPMDKIENIAEIFKSCFKELLKENNASLSY